jgi:DNA-binding beta-propeller fold protein YncE
MPGRLALLLTLLLATLLPSLPPALAHPHTGDNVVLAQAELVPLPGGCGTGTPPGDNDPVCCLFGYVFVNGQAVAGAEVTISSGGSSYTTISRAGLASEEPYFEAKLSDAPLRLQPGATLSISVSYGGQSQTVTHTVLGGGQQVDVVLPQAAGDGYGFARQLWEQTPLPSFRDPYGLAVDSAGIVYVADRRNHRVQVFNRNGQFLRSWGELGSGPGQFAYPSVVSVDSAGNVYVGDDLNSRVQKFSNTGTLLLSFGGNGSGDGQFSQIGGVAVNGQGQIYVADYDNGRMQKFDSAGRFLLEWGANGSGPGQFSQPAGVALDAAGNVYVTETGNHRVQKFDADGALITSWGGFGAGDGELNRPEGTTIDAESRVYVADTGNNRVVVYDAEGNFLRNLCACPGAGLNEPRGVAVDAGGQVFVSNVFIARIDRLDESGQIEASWGTQGAVPAGFFGPQGVAVDSANNIYVADTNNHRVQKFNPQGALIISLGRADRQAGSANGEFNFPFRVIADSQNNFYVSDSSNGRIQKFNASGQHLLNFGSPGSAVGQLNAPEGIALDAAGNLYVADTNNHRVQKFAPDGQWLNTWGSQGSGLGQFNQPEGIVVDEDGFIYVVETLNHRVQKLNSAGAAVKSWGSFGDGAGEFFYPHDITLDGDSNLLVNGENSFQKFDREGAFLGRWGVRGSNPLEFQAAEGIASDASGNIYIADTRNARIQILSAQGYTRPIATIVSAGPRSLVQGGTIELLGRGASSKGATTVVGYEWFLDTATTPFASSAVASLNTTNLAPGPHTVSFRVRDSDGELSELQAINISVAPPLLPKWTFLLYLDGDVPDLETYLNRDSPLGALYRLSESAANPHVQIVVLYDGNKPGGGDSLRYRQNAQGELLPEALPEQNMGDAQTLIDFVRWGQTVAPAQHYYLAIADHANALYGISWDYTSDPDEEERLDNNELRRALVTLTDNGSDPIDVLHLDGCLMGLLEIGYQLRGMTDYLISSENLGWSAFAYDTYQQGVTASTAPAQLATKVVTDYAALVAGRGLPYTINALDMRQIEQLTAAVDALSDALIVQLLDPAQGANRRAALASLRNQVQPLDSNGDVALTLDDDYVDLGHMVELIGRAYDDAAIKSATANVSNTLASALIAERSASGAYRGTFVDLRNTHGLGIYYPRKPGPALARIYRNELEFAAATSWDELLQIDLAALAPLPAPDPLPVAPLPFETSFTPQTRLYLPLIRR